MRQSMFLSYLCKVECADCENAFRTGYRECYVSPVKILQNIRGNMIYLFRDYIEIPLVGLLHTTGRRILICKNIKNGNKFCLFLQQMGCGSTDRGKDKADSVESKAMGRYLENELSVPEGCMKIVDLQVMEEESLKMLARNSDYELMLYQSSDKGKTWEEGKKVAGLFGVEGESIYKAALGRDGSILIGVYIESEDENSMGSMEYYYCPVDGEEKKVEIGEALGETMAWSIDIGENGNLFLQISGNGIMEINPVDGAVVHEYEKGKSTDYMFVTSEYLIVIADGDVHYYDVASGKPASGGDALTAQLKKTPANLEFGNSSGTALLFLEGDEKDTIFYVDQTGLYRYAFGGNVIEQVIDGSLNSISSSNKVFNCMAMDSEGVFYIGEVDYNSGLNGGRLVSYKYSADTPTVPDTELTIYSLEENSGIRQAVVMLSGYLSHTGNRNVWKRWCNTYRCVKNTEYGNYGRKRTGYSDSGRNFFRNLCRTGNAGGFKWNSERGRITGQHRKCLYKRGWKYL